MIRRAGVRALEQVDLLGLPGELRASETTKRIREAWENERRQQGDASLLRALFGVFFWRLTLTLILQVTFNLLTFVSAFALEALVIAVTTTSHDSSSTSSSASSASFSSSTAASIFSSSSSIFSASSSLFSSSSSSSLFSSSSFFAPSSSSFSPPSPSPLSTSLSSPSPHIPPPPSVSSLFGWVFGHEGEVAAWAAGVLVVSTVLQTVIKHHWAAQGVRMGLTARSGLVGLLHWKLLRLPGAQEGELSTLVGTDCNRMVDMAWNLHSIYIAPLTLLAASLLIVRLLGWAAAPGILLALLLVPVNGYISARFESLQETMMSKQQKRMTLLGEVLQGIDAVKYSSWEGVVAQRVRGARKEELSAVKAFNLTIAALMSVIMGTTPAMAVASFSTYTSLLHQPISPTTLFPALFLFDFLTWPLIDLPYAVGCIIAGATSIRRIQRFLERPEIEGRMQEGEEKGGEGEEEGGEEEEEGEEKEGAWIGRRGEGVSFAYPVKVKEEEEEEEDGGKDGGKDEEMEEGEGRRVVRGSINEGGGTEISMPFLGGVGEEDEEERGVGMKVPLLQGVDVEEGVVGGEGGEGGEKERELVLKDVALQVKKGELLAVVGAVGSGKTSLLLALLGELDTIVEKEGGGEEKRGGGVGGGVIGGGGGGEEEEDEGEEVDVREFRGLRGSVAYVPQVAWVRATTVQGNILSSPDPSAPPSDAERFEKVLDASCLRPDISALPKGLDTECGADGVTLSGGQCARLSLARALYADAEIYLLDDPLSAVDAHVGEHLFSDALLTYLQGKTRILVTHQLQFLPRCDRILVLENGQIKHLGTFQELSEMGVTFASLIDEDEDGAGGKEEEKDGGIEKGDKKIDHTIHHDHETAVGGGGEGYGASAMAGVPGDSSDEEDGGEEEDEEEDFWAGSEEEKEEEADWAPSKSRSDGSERGGGPRLMVVRSEGGGGWTHGLGPSLSNGSDGVTDVILPRRVGGGAEGGALGRRSVGLGGVARSDGVGVRKRREKRRKARLRELLRVSPTLQPSSKPVAVGSAVEEEERYRGAVNAQVCLRYFGSLGSVWFLVGFAVLSVVMEVFMTGVSVWFSLWADAGKSHAPAGSIAVEQLGRMLGLGSAVWLWGTGLFGIAIVVLAGVRNYAFFSAAVESAGKLHDAALGGLLRAPLGYFFAHPRGRILARFSKDLSVIDQDLPDLVSDSIVCLLEVAAKLATVSATAPFAAVSLPVLGGGYWVVSLQYRAANRELKRLDSLAASPVQALLAETIAGLASLRAFGARAITAEAQRMRRVLDRAARARWASRMADRWIGVRVELLGAIVAAAAALVAALRANNVIAGNPTLLCLAVTLAVSLNGTLNWLIRTATSAEAELSRAERLFHLAQLQPEAPLREAPPPAPETPHCCQTAQFRAGEGRESASGASLGALEGDSGDGGGGEGGGVGKRVQQAPPEGWPSAGKVEFSHVALRYRPSLPLVLRDVTFSAPAGSRLALVGRTGAGKSTVATTALLRGAEHSRGAIRIDGVDISTLGLRTLRRAIALIPQSPTLFAGTLRSNLNPHGPVSAEEEAALGADLDGVRWDPDLLSRTPLHSGPSPSDADYWDVLHAVGLGKWAMRQEGGLDVAIEDGGGNLSQGQKQLVCLARALLRRAKVIVLDEATAGVDMEADRHIQRALRTATKGATLIAIAHRLPTICDFDQIVVVDDGKVAEADHPHLLLQNPSSHYARLCRETGPKSEAFLRKRAEIAFRKRERERGGGRGE